MTATLPVQKLKRAPYRRRWRRCPIRVEGAHFDMLSQAALRRDVDPAVLLDRIVATVIGADLINAVLDDDDE